MSRTISPALQAHLNGSLLTLATCLKITRVDSVVLGLTTWDRDLTFSGTVYHSQDGVDSTALRASIGSGIDNAEVQGIISSSYIASSDLLAGLYDNAAIELFQVNWAQSPLVDRIVLVTGYIGQVTFSDGAFHAEIRALSQRLNQNIGEQTSPLCRVFQLGDSRCKVKLAAVNVSAVTNANPALVTTATAHGRVIGDSVYFQSLAGLTALNGLVFTVQSVPSSTTFTINANTVGLGTYTSGGQIGYRFAMSVLSVTSPLVLTIGADANPSGYFSYGMITFTSGANVSISREIKSHMLVSGNAQLTLAEAFPFAVAPGDGVILEAGCDRTAGICQTRFNNVVNARAEPHVPGTDALVRRGKR